MASPVTFRASDRARAEAIVALLAVVALAFACFAPALRNELLIWDDAGYIWENPHIARLDGETVAWAFGEYYANLWAPLTWLSLALDRAIWGLDPVGFHLTNVVLHALDAGLFFLVALRLLGALAAARAGADAEGAERRALRGALVAALLFAVHPLRVESVAWAAERKDVLALFFGLAAMLAYLRHIEGERVRATPPEVPPPALGTSRSFWAAVALFCLSLLAKPMLVTLPAVLLLLDWAPLGRIRAAGLRRIVAEKVPFLLASGAALAVAADSVRTNALSLAQAGVLSRGLVALESTAAYLWLTVWPLRISPFYVHPVNLARPGPEHVASAALLASITIGCALAARRGRPALLSAWLAYLVGLAPVLGFHQVGPQAMAARFTYFPSLPIALVLGAVVARAALGARRRWAARLLATGAAAWIATLAAVTVRDLSFWRDDVTLWTRVIDLHPDTGRAYLERSNGWVRRGEPERALTDVDVALAIATRKRYERVWELHVARALIHASMARYPDALADYEEALASARGGARAAVLSYRSALHREMGERALAEADAAAAAAMR